MWNYVQLVFLHCTLLSHKCACDMVRKLRVQLFISNCNIVSVLYASCECTHVYTCCHMNGWSLVRITYSHLYQGGEGVQGGRSLDGVCVVFHDFALNKVYSSFSNNFLCMCVCRFPKFALWVSCDIVCTSIHYNQIS